MLIKESDRPGKRFRVACRENLSFQTHTPDQQRQEEQVQAGSPEQEGEMGFQFILSTKRIGKPLSDAFIWEKEGCFKMKVLPPMSSSHQLLGLVTEP